PRVGVVRSQPGVPVGLVREGECRQGMRCAARVAFVAHDESIRGACARCKAEHVAMDRLSCVRPPPRSQPVIRCTWYMHTSASVGSPACQIWTPRATIRLGLLRTTSERA